MGVIKSGTNTGSFPNNFGASDSVTAAQLNAHVNDATFDTTAVDDDTIELTNSDSKLQLKDSSSKTTGTTFAKMQHISTGKVLGNASGSEGDIREIDIDADLSSVSSNDDTVPSAKATKAYVDSKSINCLLALTATQTIGALPYTITWDNEVSDSTDMHSNSTNPSRITIDTAGVYIINVNFSAISNASNDFGFDLQKNGTVIAKIHNDPNGGAGSGFGYSLSRTGLFAQNDYLEVVIKFFSGTNAGIPSGSVQINRSVTHFCATLVS